MGISSIIKKVAKKAAKKGKTKPKPNLKMKPKVVRNAKAATAASPQKKSSTPTQRAFGGGKRRGLSTGRKQGAVGMGTVGLSVSAIMAIRSKKRLDELKQKNLDANQRAAVNKALRQVAEKDAAKAKMGGVKPKARPKK
jgi:hypothetical protein|tara:strand:- start:40 stop:456 length:417 start_codon:yes stop_codon:yes gene_type:complete